MMKFGGMTTGTIEVLTVDTHMNIQAFRRIGQRGIHVSMFNPITAAAIEMTCPAVYSGGQGDTLGGLIPIRGVIGFIVAGKDSVEGDQMVQHMRDLGYQTIYSAAGPRILHLLLAADVLDRLYLTSTNRLLGGQPYSSIVEGDLFEAPVDMRLHTLIYDPHGLDGLGQLFASYDRA